jgi:hypothetical protein
MRPLLKVVALASATHPDAALLALQAELDAADQAWEVLYSKRVAAEKACFAALPPPPKEPNLDSNAIRKAFLSGEALSPETVQSLRAYDRANKARGEAMERAEHDSGLTGAEDAVNAADYVRLAIRDKIVSTRARTLNGLTFKARYAAAHFPGDPDEEVMRSIVEDLLAMGGEASHGDA